MSRRLTVSCSPDADDLFMFRALMDGLIDPGPFSWDISTADTDALNRVADDRDPPDVTAVSIGFYPRIADRYQLLPHGGSVGDGYGPVVIAPQPMGLSELSGQRIAIPGETTTAYLVLRLILDDFETSVVPITPYERIFEALDAGEVDAGLVIHEGRLTFSDLGYHQVVDIGAWWKEQTGLPLPLGGNVISRRLGEQGIAQASAVLRASIAHALEHRDEAIAWLLARGGALGNAERVSQYLDMYANGETLGYSDAAVQGLAELYRRAHAKGLLPEPVPVDLAP
jgi:1,4-dihydroxy-6-naphthoate synthase